jgi:cobalt-zinc-cadmium efflux system outer membrane protein
MLAIIVVCVSIGCTCGSHGCERACVAKSVGERMGISCGVRDCAGAPVLPNGASLDDGLTEDEAVLIALWNNAAFQELLADLDIAQADLVQAGLLPNPEVGYFFAVSEKPFKYVFDFPLEALWLRPIKIAAAEREEARVCEKLSQAALDLIRDVRQAYADALLAQGKLRVAEDAISLRTSIANAAKVRLDAGETSPQESVTANLDLLQAKQDAVKSRFDVSAAEERLRHLLGLGLDRTPFHLEAPATPLRNDLDAEALAGEALATRPDALAAEQNAAAAAERLRLSRLNWVRFLGIGDATSGRDKGHEFGPAFRVTLPIFNWNEGNVARAEAELGKAERQRDTIRDQILFDVHAANYHYQQARHEMEILARQVRPEAEAAIRRAELAYKEGNTPYIVVLETTRQLLDSRLREEQLKSDLHRAWAELERAVGRRLEASDETIKPLPSVEDPAPKAVLPPAPMP